MKDVTRVQRILLGNSAFDIRLGFCLFLAALALRLAFVWDSQDQPDFRTPTPGLDICLHWEGARHIRAGTPDPVFELMPPSAPFHPWFVAACQAVLGENVLRHRVLRAGLGALSVVAVFFLGLRITGRRGPALLAALAVLTLPSWIYFDTMPIKAGVEMFMLSLVLWLLFLDVTSWTTRRLLGLGFLLGALLALLRFSQGGTVMYAIVIAAFLLARRGFAPLRSRLCIAAALAAVVVLSQLAFVYREPLIGIPETRYLPVGGVHMRIGFQRGAVGTYQVLRRFPALPLGHTFFARMAAEAKMGRPLTPDDADRSYINEVKEFIRANPGETVRILLRKTALSVNNFEAPGNHYLSDIRRRTFLLDGPTVGYGGLVLLAFWGVAALWRERRFALLFLLGGLIAAVLVANLTTFVQWRYRLHATLPMAVLAAPGLALALDLARGAPARGAGRRRAILRLAAMLTATGGLAFLVFRPVLAGERADLMKTAASNLSLSVKAEQDARALAELEALPGLTLAQRQRRAVLLYTLARYTDSFKELEPIALEKPGELVASRQYIVYLIWYGDYDRVVTYLRRLQEHDPQTFWQLSGSFASDSVFWHGADPNLRLIIQTILRDIVSPRLGMGGPRSG
ncbi:MAG: glycosyltransferase family 39 protein [Kiritimatiellae bacterium]|nr:glycosyltransferase family 39 protein [Kiritimatiellia bacterium]